ncbi:hypothetical protein ECLT68_5002 [Escherichia coli LT-68]|nr:hypothetical protein ECLT68_5002 [Escherichia coli LT-68]
MQLVQPVTGKVNIINDFGLIYHLKAHSKAFNMIGIYA